MGFLSKNESGTPSDAACLLSKNKVNFAEMLHCEQKGSTTDNSRATIASAEMLTGCVLGEHLACLRNNTQGCSYSDRHKGLTSEWGKTLCSRVLVRRTSFIAKSSKSLCYPTAPMSLFLICRPALSCFIQHLVCVFLSLLLTSQSF